MKALRLPVPLLALLSLVLLLIFLRMGSKFSTPGVSGAVHQLLQGSPDEKERVRLVEAIRDQAAPLAGSDSEMARFLATSAMVLGDRERLREAREALGGSTIVRNTSSHRAQVEDLSLGEPAVLELLKGMIAESGGDRRGALSSYARAETGGRMWALPLVVEVAREGLSRQR